LNQLSFLDIEKPKLSGRILRDRGMKRAIEHTEQIHRSWQKVALDFLFVYAQGHNQFSAEKVREMAQGFVPTPISLRCWGAVFISGAKRGWIRQVGYIKVSNPSAHMANAALWESLIS
jgi:Holliday junction resolvasome RuvABC ATP-dependent DNA helicase subunit